VKRNLVRKSLKPQQDGKQSRKKTLKEAASEIKEEFHEKVRAETKRHFDEIAKAQEDFIETMINGPAKP
jgi:hypothetical protein